MEKIHSEYSQVGAVWAHGTIVNKSTRKNFQIWAPQLFNELVVIISELTFLSS